MSNMRSKSSQYVESLVSFIRDTKPYHSKLTEILEEYRFFEAMNVDLTDSLFSRTLKKATWSYNYFSGGNPVNRTVPFKRLVSPDIINAAINSDQVNNRGQYKALSDENTDMQGVPFVFSKKRFDGPGLVDAWLDLQSTNPQPYVEGHDFFQSHGSMEFVIQQVNLMPGNIYRPRIFETRNTGIIAAATAVTQQLANDLGNPASANRKLRALTVDILNHLNVSPTGHPGRAIAIAGANDLIAALDSGTIPPATTAGPGGMIITGPYEQIVEGATAAVIPPPPGYAGWIGENSLGVSFVDEAFANFLPPLLFNRHGETELFQDAALQYADVATGPLHVQDIDVSVNSVVYQEWTLTAQTPTTWSVEGSHSGIIGTITGGDSFTSALISFTTTVISPATSGTKIFIAPKRQITVHPSAVTEAWNIIKINPKAYSRPAFTSIRYGRIMDATGTFGKISVLDPYYLSSCVVLTATSPTTFGITSSAYPAYQETAQVDVPFNDGVLAFTIVAGTVHAFEVGDRFYVQISNGPASVSELDLYYGYDLDSFNNPDLEYNNTDPLSADFNRKINFVYDSRFTDYDTANLNLAVTQDAPNGRRFRMVAVPNGAPIATLKKDGSGPSNSVDLAESLGGATPPVYNMPGDSNLVADLRLFYANSFRLEYSDDNFVTKTVVTTLAVGSSYSNPSLGISFTLPAGSKPFIAAIDDAGIEGGDMFAFVVNNPPPTQDPIPAPLLSARMPRLVMYGDSYYSTPTSTWSIQFNGPSTYTVTGMSPFGDILPGYPVNGSLINASAVSVEGVTYRDANVHFTIKPGRGLAAGDAFSFEVFEDKPSFLVHGTVSGWAGEAEYGKWFWNGKIGFKIDLPKVGVFEDVSSVLTNIPPTGASYSFTVGEVNGIQIRPDCPSLFYRFQKTTNGFMVSRSDVGVVGWVEASGTFQDEYLTINVNSPDETFVVKVDADEIEFWNAQDVTVVRSNITELNPKMGDFVSIVKAVDSAIGLSIDYDAILIPPSLSPLNPIGINSAFRDVTTNGPPLSTYSPETAIVSGWLPVYLEKSDSLTSAAHFPDQASHFLMRSASTGQIIARIYPSGLLLKEPTVLEWNSDFFASYLPLNAEANLVAYGTGLNDKIRARITEGVNFLLGGDVLLTNALFSEVVNVSIPDLVNWYVSSTQQDSFSVTANDASHGGTLAGYDNILFDLESPPDASYDLGVPLTDHFLAAQQLAGIVPMNARQLSLSTQQRQAELSGLVGLIGDYLVNGDIAQTTLADWYLARAGAVETFASTGPGVPARGLTVGGMRSADTSASIQEAVVFMMLDSSNIQNNSATMMVNSAPPIPDVAIPPDWDDLETPLVVSTPVKTVEIVFQIAPPSTPAFSVWVKGAASPVSISATSSSIQRYVITLPQAEIFKIIVA